MSGTGMTGYSERRTAALRELFEGATWFLTPLTDTDPARYRLVHGFVSALGAMSLPTARVRRHHPLWVMSAHPSGS